MAPSDRTLTGKRVICIKECQNAFGHVMCKVGDRGKVINMHVDGSISVLMDTNLQGNSKRVPRQNFQEDRPTVEGGLLEIRWHGIPPVTQLSRQAPGSSSFAGSADIRKHFSAFLTGVYEKRERIPQLASFHTKWIQDDMSIRDTSTRLQNGIQRCAPNLPAVMSRKDFTIRDVLAAGKKVKPGNTSAGLYMILYSDFKPDTPFLGLDPIPYCGQTGNMESRRASHETATWDKKHEAYWFFHYQVARAANKAEMVQLFEHNPDEGGSRSSGAGLRDIGEQLLIVMFTSYSWRALEYAEKKGQASLTQLIADLSSSKMLCGIYTDIAKLAFARTGYAYPGFPDRPKKFGIGGGCNFTSPLGGEAYDRWEKRLWAVQEDDSMWTFSRSAMTLNKSVELFRVRPIQDSPSHIAICAAKEAKDIAPAEGDLAYTSWELMKPGKGDHKVPFFRHPSIRSHPGGNYANKSAFKVIWKSAKDQKWYVKYYQSDRGEYFLTDGSASCFLPFLRGAAIYAYFTRGTWPDAPANMPNYGKADLLMVSVDKQAGFIDVQRFIGSLVTLEGPGKKPNLEFGRWQMRQAGFDNVDGKWQGFDWAWVNDPASYEDGKLPAANSRNTAKNRKKCDFCLLKGNSGARSRTEGPSDKCVQHENTDRCKPCIQRGLPCSWSPIIKLLGIDYKRNQSGAGQKVTTATSQRFEALLCKSPFNTAACKGIEISDPGFRRVEEER